MMEQKKDQANTRRSGLQIMLGLVGLVKPLLPIMILAIVLGVLGFLCAIFLTIIAGYQLIRVILLGFGAELSISTVGVFVGGDVRIVLGALVALAVLRGILHYGEQYCNHFIAFKLLAIIRNKVFTALRRLSPAKLEGRDKGNLVSIITTDIELLEVFYAHTISPIFIGIVTSLIMLIFISSFSIWAGVIALVGYVTVGLIIPLWHGKMGTHKGMEFRSRFGDLNSFVLESLRGIDEIIQYDCGRDILEKMEMKSEELGGLQKELNGIDKSQKSLTNLTILVTSFGMFFVMLMLKQNPTGSVMFIDVLIATIAMMGSYGPVVALANLSNNLNQTLACGERVLSILEETPQVEEVVGQEEVDFAGISVQDVTFAYEEELILDQYSLEIPKGKIVGIHGPSGAGKSTMLKLLMRFFDVKDGSIQISNREIQTINTTNLRNMESYVTQETHLFHDSIANNIAIGKADASMEEIREAAKKASIHDFIESLPKGYDTSVGELGDTLSGGEKQRIGLARAFLHDAPFLLLDEPTSNLDSLNEGIILKSLQESCKEKTVVLVSHRQSTMNVADIVFDK